MKIDIIKPNLTEVKIGNLSVVFSYTTPVILINNKARESFAKRGGNLYVTTKKFSQSTSRHISHFLIEEIEKDVFNVFEVDQFAINDLLYEIERGCEDFPKGFTEVEAKVKNGKEYCPDCKKESIFEINKDQDPMYVDGVRQRECIRCGRYESKVA